MYTCPDQMCLLYSNLYVREMICRFVVAQNKLAVHVLDPLQLAHRLEILCGTASFIELIAEKQTLISEYVKQCSDLTEESTRQVDLST